MGRIRGLIRIKLLPVFAPRDRKRVMTSSVREMPWMTERPRRLSPTLSHRPPVLSSPALGVVPGDSDTGALYSPKTVLDIRTDISAEEILGRAVADRVDADH
jgi:hypothetical protein